MHGRRYDPTPRSSTSATSSLVVDPPLRTATVYRSRHDIRILTADEPLELADIVPGWTPLVGEFFG